MSEERLIEDYLTQQETNIIEAFREGAVIELTFYGSTELSRSEAEEKLSKFGAVETVEKGGSTWLRNPMDFYGVTATAFYKDEKTASE